MVTHSEWELRSNSFFILGVAKCPTLYSKFDLLFLMKVLAMNTNQSTVSQWLTQAGKSVGHALALGEDGHCTLAFGDGLQCMVELADDSDLVFMYVPLLRLPDDMAQQVLLLKFALELNLFGLQTAAALIAYDARTDHILLTFSARLDLLDADLFGSALGDVLDVALLLHEKITAFEQSMPRHNASVSGLDVFGIKA
jgi:hypothetical protein